MFGDARLALDYILTFAPQHPDQFRLHMLSHALLLLLFSLMAVTPLQAGISGLEISLAVWMAAIAAEEAHQVRSGPYRGKVGLSRLGPGNCKPISLSLFNSGHQPGHQAIPLRLLEQTGHSDSKTASDTICGNCQNRVCLSSSPISETSS